MPTLEFLINVAVILVAITAMCVAVWFRIKIKLTKRITRYFLEGQLGDVRERIGNVRETIKTLQAAQGPIGHPEPALAVYQALLEDLENQAEILVKDLGPIDADDHPWILPPV